MFKKKILYLSARKNASLIIAGQDPAEFYKAEKIPDEALSAESQIADFELFEAALRCQPTRTENLASDSWTSRFPIRKLSCAEASFL